MLFEAPEDTAQLCSCVLPKVCCLECAEQHQESQFIPVLEGPNRAPFCGVCV